MKSAEELFKYRTGLEKTVPQRGGTKDYLPDGSWLQGKRLEKYHQERESVLAEPRVLRTADLVKGEWKPDKHLVELEKEMRNFWEHMGFVDNKRKWLFPEEALFLIETNVLEVWYNGIPLSIQQARAMFLGDRFPSEHYHVYCHLRRIGYVVLRHQQSRSSTKYEKQIRLNQYINKKNRKRALKTEAETPARHSDNDASSLVKKMKIESNIPHSDEESKEMEAHIDVVSNIEDVIPDKENLEHEEISADNEAKGNENSAKIEKKEKENLELKEISADNSLSALSSLSFKLSKFAEGNENTAKMESNFNDDPQRGKNMDEVETCAAGDEGESSVTACDVLNINEQEDEEMKDSEVLNGSEKQNPTGLVSEGVMKSFSDLSVWTIRETSERLSVTKWNFDQLNLPNFGKGEDTDETVLLTRPQGRLMPGNLELAQECYQFDRKAMLNKKTTKQYRNDEVSLLDGSLEFSYPEIMRGQKKVKRSCRNWLEYKSQQWKASESWDRSHDLSHLYGDEIKPLVLPEDAVCTSAILEKLQVIQEQNQHSSVSKSKVPERVPTFDIYAPNIKFKKSAPGVPDHRVCVSKCSDPFPDLHQMTQVVQHLKDNLPLLWAVVDTGDIAFYEVRDLLLPVDLTMG